MLGVLIYCLLHLTTAFTFARLVDRPRYVFDCVYFLRFLCSSWCVETRCSHDESSVTYADELRTPATRYHPVDHNTETPPNYPLRISTIHGSTSKLSTGNEKPSLRGYHLLSATCSQRLSGITPYFPRLSKSKPHKVILAQRSI
jgi:hypothetical protein